MKKSDFSALLNAMGIDATQIVKIAMDTGLQLRRSLVKPVDILDAFANNQFWERLALMTWQQKLMPKPVFR